ncbi:NifU family protein [Mycobacterium uberis]|nr:NifU family protein [Mycobacterium uberis]
MHAVTTADPRQLRWVVAPGDLPPVGIVRHAPGRLGALLDNGVIEQLVVRTTDVLITLNTGNSWGKIGDQVQDALADALLHPAAWRTDAVTDNSANLTEIASKLLVGPISALAESHRGSIELASVSGTNVVVRMSGACKGCPSASSTLHNKLQRELRRQVGQQVTVSSETASTLLRLVKKLLSLVVR